jgi:hypothetical protein
MIVCFQNFRIALALVIAAMSPGRAADISGTYVENGMTVRASAGLPSTHVSLCGLLSREFDAAAHKILARDDRSIRITLHEDLLLEILVSGGLPGRCTLSRTKSEGLNVGPDGVTFVLKDKKSEARYRLALGNEGRLEVFVDVIPIARVARGAQHLQGVYAFPRVASPSSGIGSTRQTPNKAPEPTPGSVTPRATDPKSK